MKKVGRSFNTNIANYTQFMKINLNEFERTPCAVNVSNSTYRIIVILKGRLRTFIPRCIGFTPLSVPLKYDVIGIQVIILYHDNNM